MSDPGTYEPEQDELSRALARIRELEEFKFDAVSRLAVVAEYRDDITQEHAQRVGRTAGLLAAAIGLSEESVDTIRRAATLHDVGKVGVPESILRKPGPLSAQELEMMRTHTEIGYEMLCEGRSRLIRIGAQIALTHHEWWDGSGYPAKLAGEAIPVAGRLVAVADVFDGLTRERPYKKAWSAAEAVAEIGRSSARQFDPQIVEAFLALDHDELLSKVEVPAAMLRRRLVRLIPGAAGQPEEEQSAGEQGGSEGTSAPSPASA